MPWRMRSSIAARKADSVLPEPVGAAISVWRPALIAGHALSWGAVGSGNALANQAATAGWKLSRGILDIFLPLSPDAKVRKGESHVVRLVSKKTLPPLKRHFPNGFSRLDELMRLPQILRVDRRQRFMQGRAYFSRIDEIGETIENLVLLDHIGCLVSRPSEHAFPVNTNTRVFQWITDVNIFLWLNDAADVSLRRDQLRH